MRTFDTATIRRYDETRAPRNDGGQMNQQIVLERLQRNRAAITVKMEGNNNTGRVLWSDINWIAIQTGAGRVVVYPKAGIDCWTYDPADLDRPVLNG